VAEMGSSPRGMETKIEPYALGIGKDTAKYLMNDINVVLF